MESGLTPSATGRPASPDGDRAGWISLVTAITGLEPVNDVASPPEPGDRVAVVDHPNGDGLAGFCWARRIASGPGSPGTAEVIEMGTDPSLDPAEAAEDVEQAAMAALAAMLEADGVRTLAVCVDGRLPGLDEHLATRWVSWPDACATHTRRCPRPGLRISRRQSLVAEFGRRLGPGPLVDDHHPDRRLLPRRW